MTNYYELYVEDTQINNIILEGKFSYGLSNNHSMFIIGKVGEIRSDIPLQHGRLKVEFTPPIIDMEILEVFLENGVIIKKDQKRNGKDIYHYNSAFFSQRIREKLYYEKGMDIVEFVLDNSNI